MRGKTVEEEKWFQDNQEVNLKPRKMRKSRKMKKRRFILRGFISFKYLQNEEAQKFEKEKQDNPAWNNLYGAFELVTNNRKRNQIIIIKDLIFKIKEKFNKEFEFLSHERQRLIDTINEKNTRIKEIYETLKYDHELLKPRVNPLEKYLQNHNTF